MNMPYRLHYAPDNASLIIRLALEEMGLAYDTVLVDRTKNAQKSTQYLALNPNGLIPVLETPQGPLFETAAILLWLSDTHRALAPVVDDPQRGAYLKWLFFVSNTLHADLRIVFYPHLYVGPDDAAQSALGHTVRRRLQVHLSHLEGLAAQKPVWLDHQHPTGLSWYIACLLRWMALYPAAADRSWFDLSTMPCLYAMLSGLETRPATHTAAIAEGLGAAPFTAPCYANPLEGSAT